MKPELLPCPFCGGAAECDTMQHFRRLSDGRMDSQVAIYCTKCTCQISMVKSEHSKYDADDLLAIIVEAWNVRVTPQEADNET